MVAAITMCKDEADIVAATVGHMAGQVDEVLVLDNGSTDGTSEILDELGVQVLDDPDPAYYQARKLSALAGDAMRAGAEWIVPFDADEVWLSRDGRRIGDVLLELPEHLLVAEADLYDHVPTVRDNGGLPEWRRQAPGVLPKVACRTAEGLEIHQGNHSVSFPEVDLPPTVRNLLTIRHFPYRSVEQMIRKARNGAAAYAATDLPEDIGAHWRGYGKLTDEQLGDVFREYFWSADPEADGLVLDPCPR